MDPIQLHFPPKMVLQYAEKIASDAAKDANMPAAQLGMIQDIVQMGGASLSAADVLAGPEDAGRRRGGKRRGAGDVHPRMAGTGCFRLAAVFPHLALHNSHPTLPEPAQTEKSHTPGGIRRTGAAPPLKSSCISRSPPRNRPV